MTAVTVDDGAPRDSVFPVTRRWKGEGVNKGYAVYCDADPYFYDAPHRTAPGTGAGNSRYAAAGLPVPEGWQQNESGDWLALRPVDADLPDQGWKIHVSACLDNAESVLERVRDHCLAHGTAFKFVPSRYLLHQRNAKYADRAGSGKFITVYPADEARFERLAGELSDLLAGEPGPRILSDLRLGDGPVHVRYGGFTRRDCYDENGELRPAVARPDGVLVPDPRGPVFRVPDWVTPPAFLRPHLDARAAVTVADLPYTIESALHFSNGGGVYLARDTRTGARVVLKEARPYAGLAADGADAVTRLHRERRALERLSGLGCTPEVLDHLTVGEHHFLVLEHIDGKPLNTFFARRHPLIEADPGEERLAEYTAWALDVHARVERAVADVHARGVVFNDLHLFNIMVRENGDVALLDFEAAHHVDEPGRQTVANPGFVAPPDRRGVAVDRYALACLRLALFLPLTSLLALDRSATAERHQQCRLHPVAATENPLSTAGLMSWTCSNCRRWRPSRTSAMGDAESGQPREPAALRRQQPERHDPQLTFEPDGRGERGRPRRPAAGAPMARGRVPARVGGRRCSAGASGPRDGRREAALVRTTKTRPRQAHAVPDGADGTGPGPAPALLVLLCSVAAAAAAVAQPLVLGHTLDLLLRGGDAGHWPALSAALLVGEVLLDSLTALFTGRCNAGWTASIRSRAFTGLLRGVPDRARPYSPGDVGTRLTLNAADAGGAPAARAALAASLVTPAGALVALAFVDLWVAACVLAGLPALALVLRAFARDTGASVAAYQRVQAQIASRLLEAMEGAATIAAAGTVARERRRVLAPLAELGALGGRMWALHGRALARSGVLVPLLVLAATAVGGVRLASGSLSVGGLLAACRYGPAAPGSAARRRCWARSVRARGAGAHPGPGTAARPGVRTVRPAPGRSGRPRTARSAGAARRQGGAARGRGAGAGRPYHRRGRPQRGGQVRPGRRGRRLIDPDEGHVLLDGVRLDRLTREALRTEVAFAFERPVLGEGTVAEAVAAGPRRVSPEQVRQAVRAAGAEAFVRRLPRGHDTPLPSAPLSGGEHQRLGLARAFATRDGSWSWRRDNLQSRHRHGVRGGPGRCAARCGPGPAGSSRTARRSRRARIRWSGWRTGTRARGRAAPRVVAGGPLPVLFCAGGGGGHGGPVPHREHGPLPEGARP
ncbi:hypothetical protein SGRIM128S_01273 [Streptomyces griseomycini]